MKAEHRKELETNILADRMGNLITKMKGGPKRRTIVYVFLALLLVLIGVIVYLYMKPDTPTNVRRWLALEFGEFDVILNPSEKNNVTFKVGYLQLLHQEIWDQGVAILGSKPEAALAMLEKLESDYSQIKELCKGDLELEAESDYALAILEETRACVDIKKLASAKTKYEDAAKAYPKTRFGRLAENRHKYLADNMPKVTDFYKDLNERFRLKQVDVERRAKSKKDNKAPSKQP